MNRLLLPITVVVLVAIGCARAAKPLTETEKTFYALGQAISENLGRYELSPEELKMVLSGLEDGVTGKPSAVDMEEYGPKLSELARERAQASADKEKLASMEFMTQMAKESGAQSHDSGLLYFELVEGEGAQPTATDKVQVHYHGTLRDGTVFDSSVERGTPASFPLNRVIACWTEGVQKMKVGGKAKLVCPPSIAYGDRGSPPRIQPGAALVFEVELLGIE